MPKYDITLPSGFNLKLESDRELSGEDVDEHLQYIRSTSSDELSRGWTRPARVRTGDIKGQAKQDAKEGYDDWLLRNTQRYLQVDKNKINLNREGGDRTKVGFLSNYDSKTQYLIDKHGEENVKGVTVDGKPNFLIRDNTSGEYYYYDSPKKTPKDILDVPGGAIPATAGTLAGIATAITTKSPLTTAAAASGTELAIGSAQDVAARSLMGVDINPMQIAQSRTFDAAVGFGIDWLTGGGGKQIFKAFVGKEGTDLAATQMAKLADEGIEFRSYALAGENKLNKASELEQRFPTSKLASERNATRLRISDQADSILQGKPLDAQLETNRILNQKQAEVSNIKKEISNLQAEISEGKTKSKAIELKSKSAKEEIQAALDNQVKKQAESIGFGRKFSPEDSGRELMEKAVARRVKIEADISKQYDEAYSKLADVVFEPEDIQSAFKKYGVEVSGGAEMTLRDVVGNAAEKRIGGVGGKLEQADGYIGVRELDDLIRQFDGLSGYGKAGTSVTERSYKNLSNDLKKIRDNAISNKDGSELYADASRRHKVEVQDYRESDIFKALELKNSEYQSQVNELVAQGASLKDVKFKDGGTEFFTKALSSPQSAKDFISAAGGDSQTRDAVKRAFLTSKNIDPSVSVTKSTYSFKPKDYDMASAIDPSGKLTRSMRDLSNMASKGNIKTSLTPKEIDDLITAQTDLNRKAALATIEINSAKEQKAILGNQKLVKLMSKGEITPQTDAIDLVQPLLKSDKKDVSAFMQNIATDEGREGFERVTWEHFLREAGQGTDKAQFDRLTKQQFWDGKKGRKFLDDNASKLKLIWGEDKFNRLTVLNDGMDRFSSSPIEKEAGRATGGLFVMIENALGSAKDRVLLSAYGKGGLFRFLPEKKFVNQAQWDEYWAKTLAGLITTSTGVRSLMEEADRDPEFNAWLREQMSE